MQPKIVVSIRDLERLEAMADALPASAPGKDALLNELARAEIVEDDEVPATVVKMHSAVRFSMDGSGEELMLSLVYPNEAGKHPDTISILSPVGTALLGMAAGECIEWPKPDGGLVNVRILQVHDPLESACDSPP
ncbi:MAG TPA: nucleoside diphosphate kinase regulator [Noviherbaspirillum sp.]|jgi:regulator of nucleoside diphosphate kinase|uniref:nucleoside diphosphate kinase regulator n=1 Tax=Noviherbaspirillum sp. TaxID=1926288 RepID=UPI002F93E883